MVMISAPRVVLSGVSRGVGRSLIGTGLAFSLRKRNVGVSCCVHGPNLAQASLYQRITRRNVRTFDSRLLNRDQVIEGLSQASLGADLVLIEGRGGLFDGESPGILRGSDAELAAIAQAPVVLVIDGRTIGSSVVALVQGFRECASGFDIPGLVVNRIGESSGGEVHDRAFYDTALQTSQMEPLLGAIPEFRFEIPIPRGMYRDAATSPSLPLQFLKELGNLVEQHVDVAKLLEIASAATPVELSGREDPPEGRKCRIAVTDDSCFNLCFQDNIDLLRFYGAEITSLSVLADGALPKRIGALYLTSGNIVEYARDISANEDLKGAIRAFADQGGVIYSEGAGTAFLFREFRLGAGQAPLRGVGLIPGSATYSPGEFSYVETTTDDETIFGRRGMMVKGVQRSDWTATVEGNTPRLLRTARGLRASEPDGYSPGAQVLSTFSLFHFGSNPAVARNLVDAAQVVKSL